MARFKVKGTIKAGPRYKGPRQVIAPDPRHPSLFDSERAEQIRELRDKHTRNKEEEK